MDDLLSTYQRVLIAKNELDSEAYRMGHQIFFERLFGTTLQTNPYKEFNKYKFSLNKNLLTLDDLQKTECLLYNFM